MPALKYRMLPNGEIQEIATGKHFVVVSHRITDHGHGKRNVVWLDLGAGKTLRLARKWIDESEWTFGDGAVNVFKPKGVAAVDGVAAAMQRHKDEIRSDLNRTTYAKPTPVPSIPAVIAMVDEMGENLQNISDQLKAMLGKHA